MIKAGSVPITSPPFFSSDRGPSPAAGAVIIPLGFFGSGPSRDPECLDKL